MQTSERKCRRRGVALIVEVVNRVHRSRVAERRAAAQTGVQIHRQQSGVPVVRMEHIRRDAEELAAADDGAAEECVAMQEVVDAGTPGVDVVAIEEEVVLHQYQRYI